MVLPILLCGCLQTKDHLYIQNDGSGSMESEMTVPAGTVQLIDTMLGGMAQALTEALALPEDEVKQPQSIADEMFSKKGILKKIQDKGLNVEFEYFNKEKDEKGIHLSYKMKFDDIQQLLDSEIVSTKIIVEKDKSGNWLCRTKADTKKVEEGQMQIGQLNDFKQSEQFQGMDAIMQDMIVEAMSNLKLEFYITMPYKIKESTGFFKKVDENTAGLEFSGDLLTDPELMKKIYGMTEVSQVVWSGEEGASSMPDKPKGRGSRTKVKVHLRSGKAFKGELVEETDKYFKVRMHGVTVTYYSDEVERIDYR